MNTHRDRGHSPPRRQQTGQRPTPEFEHVEQLWPGYLERGYFDEAGNLRVEYVGREKVEPLVREMGRAKPALTQGQLRRFFQHCRRIETRLKSEEVSWAQVRAQVVFLDAAAQDAYGKQPRKVPSLFRDFVQRNIASVQSEKDFREGFLPHFEALVGFGSMHIQRDRR